MTCPSCNGKVHLPILDTKARAAMCWRCPKRHTCDKVVCPIGRWPDADGVVHWAGVRWYGAPWPIRLALAIHGARLAFGERMGHDYLPGCGCSVRLKGLWNRLKTVARATLSPLRFLLGGTQ